MRLGKGMDYPLSDSPIKFIGLSNEKKKLKINMIKAWNKLEIFTKY